MDIPQVDIDGLSTALRAGDPILDVRNLDEYEEGHVAGAICIPLGELMDRLAEVPSGQPLMVICAMGGRSQRACEFLVDQGHDVANIAGGTMAWIEAGHPVVVGSQPA